MWPQLGPGRHNFAGQVCSYPILRPQCTVAASRTPISSTPHSPFAQFRSPPGVLQRFPSIRSTCLSFFSVQFPLLIIHNGMLMDCNSQRRVTGGERPGGTSTRKLPPSLYCRSSRDWVAPMAHQVSGRIQRSFWSRMKSIVACRRCCRYYVANTRLCHVANLQCVPSLLLVLPPPRVRPPVPASTVLRPLRRLAVPARPSADVRPPTRRRRLPMRVPPARARPALAVPAAPC